MELDRVRFDDVRCTVVRSWPRPSWSIPKPVRRRRRRCSWSWTTTRPAGPPPRRAHRLLLDAGITTTGTITLPDGQDPAQLHADDPRALVNALQNPQPLPTYDIVATWMRGVRPGG